MAQVPTFPHELLTRGVEEIVVKDSLSRKLRSGRKLRIKHGVDPTNNQLHIGYAVTYWKLRQFQELGHTIVFLVGDFTGRFGDPTEKMTVRTLRDKAEVQAAAAGYLDQIKGILDLTKTEVRYNSEWYDKMSAEELLRLMSNFTTSQMFERDMFVRRQQEGLEIGLHEPVYPVLQGYDSVMLKSDVTVIGTDQLFNELQARPLQERAGQEPQDVLATSLLIGTDGKRKMSQSYGNTIGICESAGEQFGKVMRIDDGLISHYFTLATHRPRREVEQALAALQAGELAPREAKLDLATEIVALYHGAAAATKARDEFVRVFSRRELPTNIPAYRPKKQPMRVDDLLVALELASSRAAAQRLVAGGGVKIDGAMITDPLTPRQWAPGQILSVGKRHFWKIDGKSS